MLPASKRRGGRARPAEADAGQRRSAREVGKSDAIDALVVARAAVREEDLPPARLDGSEREIALLLDHREDLVAERTRIQQRLRWLLHDLDPKLEIPDRSLARPSTLRPLGRRLARLEQTMQVRICRELVRRCAELSRRADELKRELRALVKRHAPQLLALPGCAELTAAKLVAEVANIERFASDAKLAKFAGVAPLDASSGAQLRHRLNRGGNRQLNAALHRIAVTQGRTHGPAKDYLARRQAEGKTRKEALRALKRHLARLLFRLLGSLRKRQQKGVRIETRTAPSVPCLTEEQRKMEAR